MRCCFLAAGQIQSHDACSLSAASTCLTGGPFRNRESESRPQVPPWASRKAGMSPGEADVGQPLRTDSSLTPPPVSHADGVLAAKLQRVRQGSRISEWPQTAIRVGCSSGGGRSPSPWFGLRLLGLVVDEWLTIIKLSRTGKEVQMPAFESWSPPLWKREPLNKPGQHLIVSGCCPRRLADCASMPRTINTQALLPGAWLDY